MKTNLFLLIFTFLSLSIQAQPSVIAKAYFEAIQQQKIAPLEPYFLSVEQQIKLMSWPDLPQARQMLDSFNILLKDSLMVSFKNIQEELKEEGIILKKSHLVSSVRKAGVQGILELQLAYKNKKASIFIRVAGVNGRDYHYMDAMPSLEAPALSPSGYMTINQVEYPLWILRRLDRAKASKIIEDHQPLKVGGEPLPTHTYFVLVHGIITSEQHYYAHALAMEKESSTKWVIFVDLEQEKIVSIEKEIPTPPAKSITKSPSIPELLDHLEQKKGKDLAEKFRAVHQKREDFDAFMDSLRKELVEQTGGYEEKDGYKRPVGKRNKVIPTKILIEEGQANKIKKRMLALKAEWLALVEDIEKRALLDQQIVFDFGERGAKETGKTWQEYLFGQMPLAAIFPMLRKYQNDIKGAEYRVLNAFLEEE